MDYTPAAAHLAKWQWEIIRYPALFTDPFGGDEEGEFNRIFIDIKHTLLFNYVYENNLANNNTENAPYKTDEWDKEWQYSSANTEDLVNKVIKKVRDTEKDSVIDKITLADYGIYTGKHTVAGKEYPTAIYSRKKEISKIKKIMVKELEELKTDSVKKHLYCESTYIKYLVLAFYEDGETEPSLMIQAAKSSIIPSNKHLEAWMKYIGVLEEPTEQEIILTNVAWVSQKDSTVFGQCTGCWTSSCCRRACEYMMGNTNIANCSDSAIAVSAPYMSFLGRINTATFSDNTKKYTKAEYDAAVLNYDSVAMKEGITHVKDKLEAGRPVMIGVHYLGGSEPPNNVNRATRHFVVAVGYVKEEAGQEYILFYEPTTELRTNGTSSNNKLIINRQQSNIQGYFQNEKGSKLYTVTEILKTN
jgi:hypothetical protein